MFTIIAGNTSEKCEREALDEVCSRLRTLGPLSIHDGERFILVDGVARGDTAPPVTFRDVDRNPPWSKPITVALATVPSPAPVFSPAAQGYGNGSVPSPDPVYSTFGAGNQVTDDAAKVRIEAMHSALALKGIAVDASEQLYATGTRLAEQGYALQASRKAEHDKAEPVRLAGAALRDAVRAEDRKDVVVKARELARTVMVNGKITCLDGMILSEQAVRGICTRIESPMLGYILGVRNRIAEELALPAEVRNIESMRQDRRAMAHVIAHELDRAGDLEIKLRTQQALGVAFAAVSPGYAPADAPEVLDQILDRLPSDAKGTWSYDPTSTAWELRADVWTPTPVDQQAVGEPFSGYVSFQSRDNGSASFRGGGGILLLRCLNASTYTAEQKDVRRRHKGRIMVDIETMLAGATSAISALCAAWGTNRETIIATPDSVPVGVAIPGFWSYLLRDRSSELAGILPGRTSGHVAGLAAAFAEERRDESRLVRSDFAQGWTRYIQGQPTPVRRDAEQAIGDWLMSQSKVLCDMEAIRA